MKKVLIIGVGNVLMGDDAIGYCFAYALRKFVRSDDIVVECFESLDAGLIPLLEGYGLVVVIDACLGDVKKPTLYRIEVKDLELVELGFSHNLEPAELIALAKAAGFFGGEAYLLAIPVESLDMGKRLSKRVVEYTAEAAELLTKFFRKLGYDVKFDTDVFVKEVVACQDEWLRRLNA